MASAMEVDNDAAQASKVEDYSHKNNKNYEFTTSMDQNMLSVEHEVGGQTNTGGLVNQDSYLSGGLAGSLTEKIGSFNPTTAAFNEGKPLITTFEP